MTKIAGNLAQNNCSKSLAHCSTITTAAAAAATTAATTTTPLGGGDGGGGAAAAAAVFMPASLLRVLCGIGAAGQRSGST